MKHSLKITVLLLIMFFTTQLIGLFVISKYSPVTKQISSAEGNVTNITVYNLPYGMEPPSDVTPQTTLISIILAIILAVVIMFLLMKYKLEMFLRLWFFAVAALSIGITLNSFFMNYAYSSIIALIISVALAFLKVFKRNILVHNLTELAIYPGVAAVFVPLLNIWAVVVLLILISIYDIYAVWHAGFMQKMAKYQIQKLRFFTGFFVPYIGKKEKDLIEKSRNSKKKNKKLKVSVALLGGGDIVFPIILGGVVLRALGPIQAMLIALGATIALAALFFFSQKGKFYPAMPFLTIGCFVALGVSYLI